MAFQSEDEQPAAMIRGVIDQIESGVATILFDDGRRVEWPIGRLPQAAKVGDALKVPAAALIDRAAGAAGAAAADETDEAAPLIEVDAEDTAERKQRVRDLLDDIFNQG